MTQSSGPLRDTANSDLGGLADPTVAAAMLQIRGHEKGKLEKFLKDMAVIRIVEEAIAELVEKGHVRTPCHLGIGQEAVAVGVSASLLSTDRVFGGHRSHAHYLALGGGIDALFAEVMGKSTGASKGMGGSMHLVGREVGFHGSVPLVGATIPIAVGAALAAKMDGKAAVAVSYFGDGAAEEGVFHESLNLAAAMGLPVLFVCENNLFASHLDISFRQSSDRIARFSEAHGIPGATVDGNDVIAVANAASEFVRGMRAGSGPAFLEAVTYRHRGHVGPREDIDVGVRRRSVDIEAWKQRDPIRRLFVAMQSSGLVVEGDRQELEGRIRQEVSTAIRRAHDDQYPAPSDLLGMVYRSEAS